jgi:hypothetical protein
MKKHAPSEIETELRELAGSPEAYERMLDNLQAQMAEIARRRGKLDLNVDIMAPVPAQSPRRRTRVRRTSSPG